MAEHTSIENGNREVTLQDVARHLGVHPMTVSRALSGSGRISDRTRASVRQAADQLGYRPNLTARTLRQGHNPKQIALFAGHLDSGMNTKKLEAIQDLLAAAGYDVPIHSCGFHNQTGPLQTKMLGRLRSQRPAAIVYNTLLLTPDAQAELKGWIAEGGTTVVFDDDQEQSCDRVVFDRVDAGYQAAKHLLELGHRKIGHAHHSAVYHGDQRLAGVVKALSEAGLSLPSHWNLKANTPTDAVAGGRLLATEFLSIPVAERPTALSMVNDLAAMAFIAEVRKHGVEVPRHLSIVAHDDQPFAEFGSVPLTVVTHPEWQIAQEVVRLVLSRLQGQAAAEPQRSVVKGELISRASCRAI